MNQTGLNAELLSAESRGRKHIPMAVFAVILIHVVLFLVLLVAAGCRAKARAKQNAVPSQAASVLPGKAVTNAPANVIPNSLSQGTEPPVTASEPAIEHERVSAPGPERTVQRASPSRPRADFAPARATRTYVVRPGDTVGKIAKEHGISIRALRGENQLKGDLIHPGQKLRVSPPKAPQRRLASI